MSFLQKETPLKRIYTSDTKTFSEIRKSWTSAYHDKDYRPI